MSLSKKRKTEHIGEGEIYPDSLLSDVDTEIALEISLRKRLLDTLEARIAWATALKEILQQQVSGNSTPEAVRHVALDTLRVIEAPSNILLCHDPAPPFPPNSTQPTRLPSRRLIPSNNASAKPKPSFLFIRSSTLDLPFEQKGDGHRQTTLYLLKCPACSKISFTSLQGLLNHARLVHNFEWGTHEECITACAIPDNDLDVTCGTEVGVGPTGILPGLRNIFQMAVCGRNTRAGRSAIPENARDDISSTKAPLSTLTNSLNQSLGLHDESPALAPFLGKGPIRRQIRVIDEDVEVNIEGVNQHMPSSRRWRMPFSHRHSDFSSLPVFKAQNTEKKSDVESSNIEDFSLTSKTTVSADSRFHLVSRIIITDRSQWIPPEEKILQHQKYTHKWMISVDSPSYAYHITSILNSVQVTADAGAHIPVPAPKTNPPFVVLGLADKGFLAKITLSFSGPYAQTGLSLSEQTFIFEHWVDLYPIKESHIVKGQDQVVDIELDKETIIRAPRRDYTPIDSRSLWNRPFDVAPVSVSSKKDRPDYPAEKYGERLAEIVKRFPMTIEDFQGKRSKLPKVPYMLADSSKHFLSFVTGRRKAIEWGRARAIHEAYTQSLGQSSYPELPDLTVADVYSWLSEMGSFPRPTSSIPQPSTETSKDTHPSENSEPIWCRFCGLDIKVHASNSYLSKKEDTEDRLPPTEDTDSKRLDVSECSIVTPSLQIAKLPRIDVKQFVLPDLPVTHVLKTAFDAKSLLAAADPSMVQCIHRLTKQWKLSTFHTMTSEQLHLVESPSPTTMPLCQFGRNYHEVETLLAPHALLSLLTKQFVCTLISHGLDASNRDKARAFFSIHSRKGKASRSQEIGSIRILTPTHLLSGILTRGLVTTGKESKKHPMDAYLLLGMSKLGVAVDDDQSRDVRRNVFKVEDVT